MSSKLKLKRARQGQLKPDMEINHMPKLTSVECAELETFMQGNNSGVTLKDSLSENQDVMTLQGQTMHDVHR
jgi:hypothetical protein